MKIFLDTNALVSAFASRGIRADLVERVLLEHQLIVGRQVLGELGGALRDKIKPPPARAAEIVDFVAGQAFRVIYVASLGAAVYVLRASAETRSACRRRISTWRASGRSRCARRCVKGERHGNGENKHG